MVGGPVRPGGGPGNAPSSEAVYERGLLKQAGAAALARTPPPQPVPPFPPIDTEAWGHAEETALEDLVESSQQVWQTFMTARDGWWEMRARDQYEVIARHEPIYETKLKSEERKMYAAIQQGVDDAQQAVSQGALAPEQLPLMQQQAQIQAQEVAMQVEQMALDPAMYAQVPAPWLAGLYAVCRREAADRMERYAELAKEYR